MPRKKRKPIYSDKIMLDRLREHIIDNLGSVHTMHRPVWNSYRKRMASNPDFAEKVQDLVNEANYRWERMGLKALVTNNESFNVQLYKYFTMNKKPFLSHETIEMDERITALEQKQ